MKKPYLSYEEQLELFEKRGLEILDRDTALIKISNISYYKLKEFAAIFKEEDTYKKGTF